MIEDKEAIYDNQISPLMAKIIAICDEHGIPMFATFAYADDAYCTSALGLEKDALIRQFMAQANATAGTWIGHSPHGAFPNQIPKWLQELRRKRSEIV